MGVKTKHLMIASRLQIFNADYADLQARVKQEAGVRTDSGHRNAVCYRR
jgi:hypothetical protein